jgi:hypothetical protein
VRAVDEFLVDAAASYRRRRSLQCGPLRDFLPPTEASSALIALPVTSMPRGPLLDFDVEGPIGNAWLLPRTEIAAREARYLSALSEAADWAVSAELSVLLAAIVGFADGHLLDVHGNRKSVTAFLDDGLDHPLTDVARAELSQLNHRTWSMLRPRSPGPHPASAPELPALAIPDLIRSGICADPDEALDMVRQYAAAVVQMSLQEQQAETPEATVFLDVLADYGRNYDLTVATECQWTSRSR